MQELRALELRLKASRQAECIKGGKQVQFTFLETNLFSNLLTTGFLSVCLLENKFYWLF